MDSPVDSCMDSPVDSCMDSPADDSMDFLPDSIMDLLPDHIIEEKIFPRLHLKDLSNSSQVCASWNEAIKKNDSIWKAVTLASNEDHEFPLGEGCAQHFLDQFPTNQFGHSKWKRLCQQQWIWRNKNFTSLDFNHCEDQQERQDWIWSMDVNENENIMLTCSSNGYLTSWHLDDPNKKNFRLRHGAKVSGVVITSDGSKAISCGIDSKFRQWDLNDRVQIGNGIPSDWAVKMDLAHDSLIVTCGMDSSIRLIRGLLDFNSRTTPQEDLLFGHSDWVRDVQFLDYPSCTKVLSAADDGCICIFDVEYCKLISNYHAHNCPVAAASGSIDGRFGASCASDGSLAVWDFRMPTTTAKYALYNNFSYRPHPDHPRHELDFAAAVNGHAVAIAQDGSTVIVGTDYGIRVWDGRNGKLYHEISGLQAMVQGCDALKPVEYRISSCSKFKYGVSAIKSLRHSSGILIASGASVHLWNSIFPSLSKMTL